MENSVLGLSYEQVRPRLICRLVTPRDEALLKKVPFGRAFEDLLVVPCCYLGMVDGRAAGAPVSLLEAAQWEVGPQQLLRDAVDNMQRLLPPAFFPMNELMESTMSGSLRSALLQALTRRFRKTAVSDLDQLARIMAQRMSEQVQRGSGMAPMWVLGNEKWLFGAASLLFPGVLREFGRQAGTDFFILPSSIHEVILLPAGGRETRAMLYDMVRSANVRLCPDRFLSNCVYYYDRNKMEIQTL